MGGLADCRRPRKAFVAACPCLCTKSNSLLQDLRLLSSVTEIENRRAFRGTGRRTKIRFDTLESCTRPSVAEHLKWQLSATDIVNDKDNMESSRPYSTPMTAIASTAISGHGTDVSIQSSHVCIQPSVYRSRATFISMVDKITLHVQAAETEPEPYLGCSISFNLGHGCCCLCGQ